MKKIKNKGFTLIELLVVISIIGILASLALTSYGGAQKQARDTERRSDLGQYRNGLESYASVNNGLYPVYTSARDMAANFCEAGEELENFISSCPAGPLNTDVYYYLSDDTGSEYVLYTDIETDYYWYVCSSGKTGKTLTDAAPNLTVCQ